MNFEQVIEQMKAQHADQLKDMPLPPGAEDYLRARVAVGDADTLAFMVKLAWIYGAQAGQAALLHAQQMQTQPPVTKRRIEA
jgi:hypothetical protein